MGWDAQLHALERSLARMCCSFPVCFLALWASLCPAGRLEHGNLGSASSRLSQDAPQSCRGQLRLGHGCRGVFRPASRCFTLKAHQSNVRGGQKRRRATGSPSHQLVPMRSASLQRPCALGQTVTCCGGMSHTTTKSLVFHREPGTMSILIPLGLAGSVPSPCY